MLRSLARGLLPLLLSIAGAAEAAEAPPLLVATVGKPWLGREKMQAVLQSRLQDAVGQLVPALDGLRVRRRRAIARIGQRSGARWFLFVELVKKPIPGEQPFLARVRLIDTESAEVLLRFGTRYGVGGADEAGRAIARRVTEHLSLDDEEKQEPVTEAPPPPEEETALPTVEEVEQEEEEEPEEEEPEEEEPDEEEPDEEEPEEEQPGAAGLVEPPPEEQRAVVEPEPDRSRRRVARLKLGAGSGWTRSVDVRGGAVGPSALSHTLGPTALVALGAEAIIPDVNLGVAVELGFRPIRYAIDAGDADTSEPGGSIFDMFAVALYRLSFGAVALLPEIGARFSLASVAAHPRDIIPAAKTLAIIGGAKLRVFLADRVEIDAGGHGGYIPLYDESPTNTGERAGGFTAGALLAVRLHLVAGLGISLDNRLSYDAISFEERPTRGLPPGEIDLENASMALLEIQSSVSATYSF